MPERLSDVESRPVLVYCLTEAAAPVNPYAEPALAVAARLSAAAILREHPLLDDEVLNRIGTAGEQGALEIYAAVLRRRSYNRAANVAQLFQRWQPGSAAAVAFGAAADVVRLRDADSDRKSHSGMAASLVQGLSRLFVRWLVVPLTLSLWGFVAWHLELSPAPIRLSFGEVVAALAVIAAIHVVSTQLAADRLDGVIARKSTSSIWIIWSYSLAIAVGATDFISSHGRVTTAIGWLTTVAGAAFLLSVALAARALVRQSEPAYAALVFARSQRLRHQWTGRRLGKLRAKAITVRETLASMQTLILVAHPIYVERRKRVLASRRGFHLVHLRRIRRLRRRKSWAEGHLWLHVLGTVGTIVDPGEEIGAVIPDETTALIEGDFRRARRAFHQHSAKAVEEAAEAAVVLIRLVGVLAERGDSGGAKRTAGTVIRMLERYAAAASLQHDERVDIGELAPVLLPMRAAAEAIGAAVSSSGTHLAREELCNLAERFVDVGRREDAAVVLLFSQLPNFEEAINPIQMAGIVRAMSLRVLQNGDRIQLAELREFVGRRLMSNGSPVDALVDAASEVPAIAAWIFQPAAMGCWEWYRDCLTAHMGDVNCLVGAVRAGSANLAAGSLSVATQVAIDLGQFVNWPNTGPWLLSQAMIPRHEFSSTFGGGYLGRRPSDAINEFVTFANDVAGAVH